MDLAHRKEKHRRDFHEQKGAGQGSSTSKAVTLGCDKATFRRALLGQVILIYGFKTPVLGEAETIIKVSLGFVMRV